MSTIHHATLVFISPVIEFDLSVFGDLPEVDDSYTEKFIIGNARDLVTVANRRPLNSKLKTLVIRAEYITQEAQNALLKILEEPPVSTQFIFILPPGFQLLQTLASRFSEFSLAGTSPAKTAFVALLSDSYKDRLATIDNKLKKEDVVWQQSIKQGLVQYLNSPATKSVSELEYVARFLLTKGASNKILFEHMALLLPARSS